jgi:putative protease
LETARLAGLERLPRAPEKPAAYPDDALSYLGNVFNAKARDFYARHGVKLIAAAYESHEETGEVSLMITKHCVRYSLSLCPRQTQGVTGVHGTVKAEPLSLINGDETLTLRFDCKACEMHVMGKLKRSVVNQRAKEMKAAPMRFYKRRNEAAG